MKKLVKRVLSDAARTANFFDYSDTERMTWMIVRAYEIGKRHERLASRKVGAGKFPPLHRLKAKQSQMAG